jgi:hypothetical protein
MPRPLSSPSLPTMRRASRLLIVSRELQKRERVSSGESALLQEDREIIPDLMGARLLRSVGTNDGFGLNPHSAAGARSHSDGEVFEQAWMRKDSRWNGTTSG